MTSQSRYSIVQDLTVSKTTKLIEIETLEQEMRTAEQNLKNLKEMNTKKITMLKEIINELEKGIKAIQDVSKTAAKTQK